MLNMSRSISSLGLQVGEAKAPDSKKCKAEVNPKVEEAASDGSVGDRVQKQGKGKNSSKPAAEPPKDYVHVRARRGQATDSHSLAERVTKHTEICTNSCQIWGLSGNSHTVLCGLIG